MATHSNILAWQKSLAGYSAWGCLELDMIEELSMRMHTHTHTHTHTQNMYFNKKHILILCV